MQQVSSVRGQHLDESDWKSLCLAEWIQRGQQRDPSTGTRLRTGAGLAELDARSHRIRSGGIFHLRRSAARRGGASRLVHNGRAANVIHADGSHEKSHSWTRKYPDICTTIGGGTALSSPDACPTPKPKQKELLRHWRKTRL